MPSRDIHPGLFTSPPHPRLLAGRCSPCGALSFPTSEFCPYCSAPSPAVEEVGQSGKLYLHTIVNTAPPGYPGPVPYGFGLVDLSEGLRVVSRLVARDLSSLASGMEMSLAVDPLFTDEDGAAVLSWAYRPSAEANPPREKPDEKS